MVRAFFGRIAQARLERQLEAVERIRQAGGTVGKSGVLEWRADAWYLEHSPDTRHDWHEHREMTVEAGGVITHEHRMVRDATDAELLEMERKVAEMRSQRALRDSQHAVIDATPSIASEEP